MLPWPPWPWPYVLGVPVQMVGRWTPTSIPIFSQTSWPSRRCMIAWTNWCNDQMRR